MAYVPGTSYRVAYRLSGGGDGTAQLTYVESRTTEGQPGEGEGKADKPILHRFLVDDENLMDMPAAYRSVVQGIVTIPDEAIIASTSLDE